MKLRGQPGTPATRRGYSRLFRGVAQLICLNPPAASFFVTYRKARLLPNPADVLDVRRARGTEEAEQWQWRRLMFRSCGMVEDGPVAPASTPSPDQDEEATRQAADYAAYASLSQ